MNSESLKESLLAARVDRIVGAAAVAAAAASGAGLVGTTENADAAIVYSGPVNIAIPNNIDGLYMNLVTGASGTAPVAGWDINPYTASAGNFNLWGASTTTWMFTGAAIETGVFVHAQGTLVDGSQTFGRPGGDLPVTAQLTLNADNYFGVRFTNESAGNAINFGWVRIAFGATAGDRAITGYAYEDTGAGIIIGVPEPSVLGLLATGAVGLFAARRRRAAAA